MTLSLNLNTDAFGDVGDRELSCSLVRERDLFSARVLAANRLYVFVVCLHFSLFPSGVGD